MTVEPTQLDAALIANQRIAALGKNKLMMSGLLAAPLVTILLIAGCSVSSPGPTETPNPSPSISASADPSASPAPTQEPPAPPAPSVEAGQTVDAATAETLYKESGGQFKGYAMPDGSYIVVDKQAPLPAPVQAVADGQASQVQAANPVQTASSDALAEIDKLPGKFSAQTGKRVLVVSHISGFDYEGNPVEAWFVVGGPRVNHAMYSEAEATEAAQNYINGQNAPAEWAIVVAR